MTVPKPLFLLVSTLLISHVLANGPTTALNQGLVINEVHYDAEDKTQFIEFVELLNTSDTTLDVSGYFFSDGFTFTFPAGTTLAPTEYVLLAENPTELNSAFSSIPNGTRVFEYSGSLSNDGETLTLRDASSGPVDSVDYRAEFPWPISPNGDGDSMQLINASLDNDLGGAWRGEIPSPGCENINFSNNAPPLIRQVDHSPQEPTSSDGIVISAKVTDPDGLSSVNVLYQIVSPGQFIPATLPQPYSQLLSNPNGEGSANPAFENPANWTTLPMVDDGTSSDTYIATIPAQDHRTLVRYRIVAVDLLNESIRVPYPKDASRNFATFVYDGVPAYTTNSTTHSSTNLTSIPVYQMITRNEDRAYAFAYQSTGDNFRISKGHPARKNYNWECAIVHDGVVYDHVGWRLRQNNNRYSGNGKRSLRFRMNRGHYFQARGEDGKKLPVKWRRWNTSKGSSFGSATTYGLRENMNSKLWRMVDVEAPYFLPAHWRMIDAANEAPDQWNGDFFGFTTIIQDINGRLLDERNLADGNVYKLKDGVTNPLELQRNQTRTAVSNGSDFTNIKNNLNSSRTNAWLDEHVDWEQWNRYHTVVEAVRHYDFGTPSSHFKNRAWYFQETAGTPQGLLRVIPHDHDASWSRGYHDNLNNVGNSIGTGFPWAAVFDDILRPPAGNEKPTFTIPYRNFVREFRQLLWQEETVNAMLDDTGASITNFSFADIERWTGGPAAAGVENMVPVSNVISPMKSMAFTIDTMYGANLPGGRGAFLDQISADTDIPLKPTISYSGNVDFPADGLQFTSSAFADPQGSNTFAAMEWRVAEVAGLETTNGTELLPAGSTWSYLDNGSNQGTAWQAPGFNDSNWPTTGTPAGYGTITNTTLATPLLSFGPNSQNKYLTTYFRRKFNVTDPTLFGSLELSMNIDDGAVVYLNGVEILRDNMLTGIIGFNTTASGRGNEGIYDKFTVPSNNLVAGENTIAIEVHQRSGDSSDICMDLGLTGIPPVPQRTFEWFATWESGELAAFNASIAPPAVATRADRTYRARVRHQDTTGRWSEWSDALEFTATAPAIDEYIDSLVISEIMYNPSDPTTAEVAAGYDDADEFEYLEILNIGSTTLDLSDVRFTKGIDIDLSGVLAPGARLLVVENEAAFEFRYGSGLPVFGQWSGKLSNGGENLKLSFGAGLAIREFEYDDVTPWPTGADGVGPALVLVDPFGLPDHASALSWRAATPNPGSTDSTIFPGDDLPAYAFGGKTPTIATLPDGSLELGLQINQQAEDISGEWEQSGNLVNWSPVPAITHDSSTALPAGFALNTYLLTQETRENKLYLRYRVTLRTSE